MTNSDGTKGLLLSIYRNAELGDCTNGGITATAKRLVVTGVRHGWTRDEGTVEPLPADSRVFSPTDDAPEVTLVIRDNGYHHWLHLEPVAGTPEGHTTYMMGGNYAGTSDARWSELVGDHGPVAVHDRTETWAQYDANWD